MREVSEQSGDCGPEALDDEAPDQPSAKVERVLTICNRRGLHARASARFVQTVDLFDAEVTVKRDGMSVGGQSIMGLMMLAATKGCDVHVSATGRDATAVLTALKTLVDDRFGEES